MADQSSKKRKPRVRKAPASPEPTSEVMESISSPGVTKPKSGLFSKLFQNPLFGVLGVVFGPLGRVLRLLVPRYFINSWREVKQVTWPSRRETFRLTIAVFIFAIVFGGLVAGVDKGLDDFFKKVILK